MARTIGLFFLVAVLSFFAATSQAAILRYEPFDYSDVGGPVLGKTNPDGATWVAAHASPAPTVINVASGNLAMPPEMAPPVGNSAEIDGIGTNSSQSGKAIRLPLGE